ISRDRPVRTLVEQSEGAQLLVTGSHGRGGFRGMLLGSTSRALLQSAPCPMMVVRPVE
uniref:universal stress protein n=1 Tax=Corynebacterium sp. TaxID=1720 RepID=UPI0037365BBE